VATLLHLSDLHLGTGGDEHFGDHKLEVIAPDQRESRSQMLRWSLASLHRSLHERGETLDAVVVSGDVTYQASSDGLRMLDATLDALEASRPANDRIVVVPGNHDVAWDTPPGSAERYAAFRQHIRDAGFVTPLLEGVDPDPADHDLGVLTATDDSFVVVALNSADHCGVRQQVDRDEQAALEEVDASGNTVAQRVGAMWRRASLFDVARVGPRQREHGSQALTAALTKPRTDPAVVPLRIATFHHQLLPISLDEEIKPFEALTNLAQVRDWMADNDIELLLHGHKHVAHTYLDHYVPLAGSGPAPRPRRLIVSSVGTVGLGQPSTNTVARLVRVDPRRTRLGKVEFVDVPSSRPGMSVMLNQPGRRHLVRVADADRAEIVGRSVDEVHEQIVERLEAGVELVGPLVCRIEDPSDAHRPTVPLRTLMRDDVDDVDAWFSDTVDLWQREQPYSAMDFNHGERILRYDGTVDLIDRVARVLSAERDTSRGVISLLDHRSDDVSSARRFPAFCLVQLFIRHGRLVTVGYFRKQEMRYWWPVNVAELARLQGHVRTKLSAMSQPALAIGEIVTVTAIPTTGKAIPRVVVPQLDRWVDDDPERLTRMCLSLLAPSVVDIPAACADWRVLLEECEPSTAPAADGGPVPIAGLDVVLRRLSALERIVAGPADVRTVQTSLAGLVSQHREYQEVTRRNDRNPELRGRLVGTLQTLRLELQRLLPTLTEVAGQTGPPDPADAPSPPGAGS
jgi:hypothetical protein